MIRMAGLFMSCLMVAGVAMADQTSIETLTGGGSIAQNGAVVLNGAIAGAGLPGDNAGLSQNGALVLGVGYYPALIGQAFAENMADPIWLQLGRMLAPAGTGLREVAGAVLTLVPGGFGAQIG